MGRERERQETKRGVGGLEIQTFWAMMLFSSTSHNLGVDIGEQISSIRVETKVAAETNRFKEIPPIHRANRTWYKRGTQK